MLEGLQIIMKKINFARITATKKGLSLLPPQHKKYYYSRAVINIRKREKRTFCGGEGRRKARLIQADMNISRS